jgi:hypothetical protein
MKSTEESCSRPSESRSTVSWSLLQSGIQSDPSLKIADLPPKFVLGCAGGRRSSGPHQISLRIMESDQLEYYVVNPSEKRPATRFDPIQDLQVERLPVKFPAFSEVDAQTVARLAQCRKTDLTRSA